MRTISERDLPAIWTGVALTFRPQAGSEPEEAVPPDELFDRLQPFKDRVAEDIRSGDDDPDQ